MTDGYLCDYMVAFIAVFLTKAITFILALLYFLLTHHTLASSFYHTGSFITVCRMFLQLRNFL